MSPTRFLCLPTLLLLGLSFAAGCGEEPTKGRKLPNFNFPKPDGGTADGGDEITCDGESVGTEEVRTRYEAATVGEGEDCVEEEQKRTCGEDGDWSAWSGSFTNRNCTTEETTTGCTDGATESRERWDAIISGNDAGEVTSGECVSETQMRTCTDGEWGDWSGTYEFMNCPITVTYDECDGMAHGTTTTRTMFATATVPYGENCQSETQTGTCNDGTWEYDGTFTEAACEPEAAPAGCGDQAHGAQRTRNLYDVASVEKPATCASHAHAQTSQCDNGTWTDWTPAAGAGFTHEACIEYEANESPCTNPNGGAPIPHGQTHTWVRYTASSVPFGVSCDTVKDEEEVTCSDGTLPPYSGPAAHTQCTPAQPASCTSGAQTIAHGQPDPVKLVRYESASVAHDKTCVSQERVRTCNNGTWGEYSGSFTHETCVKNCNGGAHGAVQNRVRFSAPTVGKDSSCDTIDQEQTRTCTNGVWGPGPVSREGWTGDDLYAHAQCAVRGESCEWDGDDFEDGTVVTSRKRYAAAFSDTACQMQTQERLCDDGDVTNWTPNSYTYRACGSYRDSEDNTPTGESSCRWVENTGSGKIPHCIEYDGNPQGTYKNTCENRTEGVWNASYGCPTLGAFSRCVRAEGDEYYYIDPGLVLCLSYEEL